MLHSLIKKYIYKQNAMQRMAPELYSMALTLGSLTGKQALQGGRGKTG